MSATRALIHVDNLRHNIGAIRKTIGTAALCLSVKANGYGHGADLVARVAEEEGVAALGVANPTEGVRLREQGVALPIHVFGNPFPEEMDTVVDHDLVPFIVDETGVRALAEVCSSRGVTARASLKIDTGMGRIGCTPEEAPALAGLIARSPGVRLFGVGTHFAGADLCDQSYTAWQLDRFHRALAAIRDAGVDVGVVHAANTGAVIGCPEARFDMVRAGIAAYGYYPSDEQPRKLGLRPVMELVTRVSFVKRVAAGTAISYGMTYHAERETVIATLPVGYGDGYSRLLSDKARVLIRGALYPVVGRVCMDQCMVDLGPDASIAAGEEVVLFGPDPAGPDAEALATIMGTIPYEVTCLVTARVTRVPIGD
jgi:alanine racemase